MGLPHRCRYMYLSTNTQNTTCAAREKSLQSAFSLIADPDVELDSAIPPGAIVDLEIAGVSRSLGRILLTWTAVGANGESPFTKVDKYEVCSGWNPFKLWAQWEGYPVGHGEYPCFHVSICVSIS